MKKIISSIILICITTGVLSVFATIPMMDIEGEVIRAEQGGNLINDVDYNGETAVIVGSSGYVAVSQDLVNWTELSFSAIEDFRHVAWSDGKFIIPCIAGAYLSTDGYTWEKVSFDTAESAQAITGVGFYSGDNIWNIVKSDGRCIRPFEDDITKRFFINKLFFSYYSHEEFSGRNYNEEIEIYYTVDSIVNPAVKVRAPRCITYYNGVYSVYSCYYENLTYSGVEEMIIEIWSSSDLKKWESTSYKIYTTSVNSICMASNGANIVHLYYMSPDGMKEMTSTNGSAFVETNRTPAGLKNQIVFLDGSTVEFGGDTLYAAKPGQLYSKMRIESQSLDELAMYWTGREWCANNSFSTEGLIWPEGTTDDQKLYLSNASTRLVWTGEDYLAYSISHTWYHYGEQKYMYRIAEDQKTILNIYPVPGWISDLVYTNGKCAIAAGDIRPTKDQSIPNRVLGVTNVGWGLYTSSDFVNWKRNDMPELDGVRKAPLLTNGQRGILPITEAQIRSAFSSIDKCVTMLSYIDGELSFPIKYETLNPLNTGVCGHYYYTSEECGEDAEKDTVVAFSKDGIYWVGIVLPNHIGGVQKVYELYNKVVVECYTNAKTYVSFDKEQLYKSLENMLNREQVFVQCQETFLGFDTPPVLESDRTLVPMRFLFEKLGAEVTWNETTNTATATLPANGTEQIQTFGMAQSKSVSFSIDNTTATVNGAVKEMDVPARLINDRTMVPLRFLSENLGYTVTWDEATKTAIIE